MKQTLHPPNDALHVEILDLKNKHEEFELSMPPSSKKLRPTLIPRYRLFGVKIKLPLL